MLVHLMNGEGWHSVMCDLIPSRPDPADTNRLSRPRLIRNVVQLWIVCTIFCIFLYIMDDELSILNGWMTLNALTGLILLLLYPWNNYGGTWYEVTSRSVFHIEKYKYSTLAYFETPFVGIFLCRRKLVLDKNKFFYINNE